MLSNISAVNTKVFQEMRLIDEKHLNEIKDKKALTYRQLIKQTFLFILITGQLRIMYLISYEPIIN